MSQLDEQREGKGEGGTGVRDISVNRSPYQCLGCYEVSIKQLTLDTDNDAMRAELFGFQPIHVPVYSL